MKSFRTVFFVFAMLGILGCSDAGLAGSTTTGCVQGSGQPKTVERPVAAFNGVIIDGVFEVVFVFGENTALSLTAEDNLLPYIVTEVANGTLHIRTQGSICATTAMQIRVGTDSLEKVMSNGASDMWLEKVDGGSLDIVIAGSGSVRASGRAKRFAVDIRGAAEVWAKDLEADNVRIDISGAGDAEVFASQKLHVDISGAGTVAYHGRPTEVTREISGAGELISR